MHASVPWQAPPAQHAWPMAPHIPHVAGMPPPGALQPSPALQTLFGQHASPMPPHAVQVLPPPPPAAVHMSVS
jgi:hypothetical protein